MYFDGIRTIDDEVQMKETIETKGRAIGYCRVSTALQEAEGYSLEAQQKAIEEYCAKANLELLDTYTEQASGRSNNREIVNKVIKRCRSTNSTLVIARLDRFTRDLHFLTSLQKQKFKFIALDNPNADSMVIQIMMSVAENESRMISTRTRTALRIAKENGVELGNHRSILATYKRLERDKRVGLTREDDNLWDTFCIYRTAWNDYVVNHKNYKLFRKYIEPIYEVVDTGLGWEEYIRKPNPYGDDIDAFWDNYQKEVNPDKLIGQRYINGNFDIYAFGDLCEDAFLMNPLDHSDKYDDTWLSGDRTDTYRALTGAFHLPQLDMTRSRKKIDATGMHYKSHIRRFTHRAEITCKHSQFLGIGNGEVKIRAYDIGRLWKQLLRDNTRMATLSRVATAREEVIDIYLPAINEAREKGITGVRPLARYLTEQGIITPKGNQTWSPSSVQSILRQEEAMNISDNITEYDEVDETNDLAMAMTFNDYGRGKGSYQQETPIRDPETGHITRFYTKANENLDTMIKMFTELNSDKDRRQMDLSELYKLKEQNIKKEPLFDNPTPRVKNG